MAKKIVVPDGGKVIWALCDAICAAKGYLSEIDGAIGDGDHGVNMAKGFSLAKERISEDDPLSDALETLGDTLLDDIGGSMGPIYGTLFMSLSDGISDGEDDDDLGLSQALACATEEVENLAGAKPGDKTLVDTLAPAAEAYASARARGADLAECLDEMAKAAEAGWKSTEGMIAHKGRASRLGERSKNHLDAGATSCNIVLQTLAHELKSRIEG